jgi:hypothetical protein
MWKLEGGMELKLLRAGANSGAIETANSRPEM